MILFKDRTFTISGTINNEIMAELYSRVEEIFINEKDVKHKEDLEPIKIMINSFGTDVLEMILSFLTLCDNWKGNRAEIYTYNIGSCQSGGAILYLAGDKRYVYEGSYFMIHGSLIDINTCGIPNNTFEAFTEITRYKDNIACKILSDKTDIPRDIIDTWFNNCTYNYLTPEEAFDCGLATDKIEYTIRS